MRARNQCHRRTGSQPLASLAGWPQSHLCVLPYFRCACLLRWVFVSACRRARSHGAQWRSFVRCAARVVARVRVFFAVHSSRVSLSFLPQPTLTCSSPTVRVLGSPGSLCGEAAALQLCSSRSSRAPGGLLTLLSCGVCGGSCRVTTDDRRIKLIRAAWIEWTGAIHRR